MKKVMIICNYLLGLINFRKELAQKLLNKKFEIIVFWSTSNTEIFADCKVVNDFYKFKNINNVINANRIGEAFKNIKDKVYTSDLCRKN